MSSIRDPRSALHPSSVKTYTGSCCVPVVIGGPPLLPMVTDADFVPSQPMNPMLDVVDELYNWYVG